MGRTLSSALRQELANLDKDADSHKSAMEALKSYVKDLDSKAIPSFLAQVSEMKETGSLSGEYAISLFEVLARVHGAKITPHIDNIMSMIIKTLASSTGSFPLQQACSKVVSAIARYGIELDTLADEKMHIIHSLCKPLSDSLLGSQESLASGAALCLKALVDCDNWRCASDEMVNKVCQNVAVALEMNLNEMNSHMALVMALAKHNPFILEAYARLLVHSGLRILDSGVAEGNSQKRLLAIQMLNFLMKALDSGSMYSELDLIIQEMGKCQCDKMHFVKMAAYEAGQTAKRIAGEKDSKFEISYTGSNGRNISRRNLTGVDDQSIMSASPKTQPYHSFNGYDSQVGSPSLIRHASSNSENDCWSVNCKPQGYKNERIDKDRLFSGVAMGSSVSDPPLVPCGNYNDEFTGFQRGTPRNGLLRSATSSPRRSRSCTNIDNINILTPPRILNSDISENQIGSLRISCSRKSERDPTPCSIKFEGSPMHHHGFAHDLFTELRENGEICTDGSEQSDGRAESVSSTDDAPLDTDMQRNPNLVARSRPQMLMKPPKMGRSKNLLRMVLSLFAIAVAGFASYLVVYVQDEEHYLVPT